MARWPRLVVEVIGVVVVADQYQVHRPELVVGDHRADGLGEIAMRTRGVKGGVTDNSQAGDVEDGRRAAHHHGCTFLPFHHDPNPNHHPSVDRIDRCMRLTVPDSRRPRLEAPAATRVNAVFPWPG
jgi:hypothetical protein